MTNAPRGAPTEMPPRLRVIQNVPHVNDCVTKKTTRPLQKGQANETKIPPNAYAHPFGGT
ncbi:MAG: hypothetical protein B7X04_02320 [Parcubacteria group bacterium 21-54-25]|nr:MAG: hypothetical protein B7X04_02320 [Parcubacteria group bacterium 21-54-25]